MLVQDIMTAHPTCCTPEMSLREVAAYMVECDCGEIPVVQGKGSGRPIGVLTDRDIACRAVARGKNPLELKARDVMSSPVVTVPVDADVEECCRAMEQARIRRVPVVDAAGNCCGIVSQADIICSGLDHKAAEVLRDVSRPSRSTYRSSALVH